MSDKIKVVNDDMMCFPVDAVTLEAISCSFYDPYAWTTPNPAYVETIDTSELHNRRQRTYYNPTGE